MKKSVTKSVYAPWQLQLLVLIAQYIIYLSVSWLDTYYYQPLTSSLLDKLFWFVFIPLTWLVYTLLSYQYSQNYWRAAVQGLIQTIVSYVLVIGSSLAFYTWIG